MSHHLYRGHRAQSFLAVDINELIELRARQRTFSGAYGRTALGNLGYALTILRLFDRRFYNIGLLFAILGGVIFILSYLRERHSNHDFADYDAEIDMDDLGHEDQHALATSAGSRPLDRTRTLRTRRIIRYAQKRYTTIIQTTGQEGKRIYGRPFITAGTIVLAMFFAVGAMEIALLALVIRI